MYESLKTSLYYRFIAIMSPKKLHPQVIMENKEIPGNNCMQNLRTNQIFLTILFTQA